MKKRFIVLLMAAVLLLCGSALASGLTVTVPESKLVRDASGEAEQSEGVAVDVPSSKLAGDTLPSGSVSEEAQGDIMGQIEDLLHDELVLTATLASGGSDPKFDLSGFSYEELVALKDCINLAIWESEEWQEVTVPQGVWVVGEDIPAGKWTIKCADGAFRTEICWGDYLSEDGTSVSNKNRGEKYVYISNPDHKWYDAGDMTEYTVTLQVGDYVEVAHDEDAAVFTPYAGKPSLGFK